MYGEWMGNEWEFCWMFQILVVVWIMVAYEKSAPWWRTLPTSWTRGLLFCPNLHRGLVEEWWSKKILLPEWWIDWASATHSVILIRSWYFVSGSRNLFIREEREGGRYCVSLKRFSHSDTGIRKISGSDQQYAVAYMLRIWTLQFPSGTHSIFFRLWSELDPF